MSHCQIAVIVGSLRRDSFNRKLAEAMAKLAPPAFSFSQVRIGDLPLYKGWRGRYVAWVARARGLMAAP